MALATGGSVGRASPIRALTDSTTAKSLGDRPDSGRSAGARRRLFGGRSAGGPTGLLSGRSAGGAIQVARREIRLRERS